MSQKHRMRWAQGPAVPKCPKNLRQLQQDEMRERIRETASVLITLCPPPATTFCLEKPEAAGVAGRWP